MRPRRVASHLARLRLSQRQDTSAATQAPCRPRVRLTRKLRCAAPRHPARRMWKQMLSVVRDGRRKSTCMLSFPICPLFSLRSENSGVLHGGQEKTPSKSRARRSNTWWSRTRTRCRSRKRRRRSRRARARACSLAVRSHSQRSVVVPMPLLVQRRSRAGAPSFLLP